MTKLAFAFCLVLCTAATTWGQTSTDLAAKYRPVVSYEVRPHVVMTPRYAADGQVCEVVLEKRHAIESEIDFDSYFSDEEVRALTDELIPKAERGKAERGEGLAEFLNTRIDGRIFTTEYRYENVVILVDGVVDVDDLARLLKGQEVPPECPERTMQCAGNMVITITWRKRTCSGEQPPPE